MLGNLGRLRARVPRLPDLCGMPRFWLRAALATSIHDLGKCCAGFQQMVRGGARFGHRHEVLSVLFLRWILGCDAEDDLPWAAAAIATHHKDWPEVDRLYPPADPSLDSTDGLEPLVAEIDGQFFAGAGRVLRDEIWPVLAANWVLPPAWSEAVREEWIPARPLEEARAALSSVQRLVARLKQQNAPSGLSRSFRNQWLDSSGGIGVGPAERLG